MKRGGGILEHHWTTPLSKKDLQHLLDNHLFSKESFIMLRKYRQSFAHGDAAICSDCRQIAIKLGLGYLNNREKE